MIELALSNRNEDLLRGDADIAVRMVRPTQSGLIAKRIGRIDCGFYAHHRYLQGRALPHSLQDLGQHALIGYDRDPACEQMIKAMGMPLTRDSFAFRSDSDLAQLSALRAGFGIGVSQLGIAKKDTNLVPLLHAEFAFSMDAWVAMHRDLRSNHRIRRVFEYLSQQLARYAKTSSNVR